MVRSSALRSLRSFWYYDLLSFREFGIRKKSDAFALYHLNLNVFTSTQYTH